MKAKATEGFEVRASVRFRDPGFDLRSHLATAEKGGAVGPLRLGLGKEAARLRSQGLKGFVWNCGVGGAPSYSTVAHIGQRSEDDRVSARRSPPPPIPHK